MFTLSVYRGFAKRVCTGLLASAAGLFMGISHAATANNVATDFSATSNPNGVWSYGYESTLGGTLNLYDQSGNDPAGYDYWRSVVEASVIPEDIHNPTGSPIDLGTSVTIPAGGAMFHPGRNGEYSVYRFTAPADGTYDLVVTFTGLDFTGPTSTDVHILKNSTSIFDGSVNGYGGSSTVPYTASVSLNTGDTVDFAVGDGNNGYLYDSTGIDAVVLPSPGLENGSFEVGPGGTYAYLSAGSTDLTGWTTTQNGVEWFDPTIYGWSAAENGGTYAIDLAPTTYTGGGIEQTVSTQPGQYYRIQFYGATSLSHTRDGTGQVDVRVNGGLLRSFDLVNTNDALDWHLYTAYFKASRATTTIEFQNNQDATKHFAFIDDVTVAATLPPTDDLTVDSITVSPSPAAVGQTVTITATVRNTGTTHADNFHVDVYKSLASPPTVGQVGDAPTCIVDTLPPGGTYTCPPWQVTYDTAANTVAWTQVDTENSVNETNEGNNTAHDGFAVMLPDLRVTGLTVPSTPVAVGQTVTLSATVRNASLVDVTGNFQVDISSTDSNNTTVSDIPCTVSGLDANATIACSGDVTYSRAGTYSVLAQADTQNTVNESHEDNNEMGPSTVSVVNTYVLALTTDGTGTGTVSGAGTYNDGTAVSVSATATAGSTFTGWTGPAAAECATGTVVMNADKSCRANFDAVAAAPPADLVVSSLTTNPARLAHVGNSVIITATIRNNGGTTANNFQVDLYSNLSKPPAVDTTGDVTVTCTGSSLDPGSSMICTGTVTYSTAGTKVVWAQADTMNTVGESNESNNTNHVGLSVR